MIPLSPPETLARLIEELKHIENSLAPQHEKINISIFRNYTIESIEPYLRYYLLNQSISPNISFGGYDTIIQDLLAFDTPQARQNTDVIILSLILSKFDPQSTMPNWTCRETWDRLQLIYDQASARPCSLVIVNTFLPSFYSVNGIAIERENFDQEVFQINQNIRKFVESNKKFILVDWERIIRLLGEKESIDYRFMYLSKAPFKGKFLRSYANEITKAIKALKGLSKKCLIVDCDNTLWGGVIGEDGLNGIKLDPNDWPGNVYYEFQKSVFFLRERGVLIAICSKNNEADVFEVLEKHPHSLIKKKDLVTWRINWNDKVSNILSIVEELNIGKNSVVFVDDSPMECAVIREAIPEIEIRRVPKELSRYPLLLLEEGLFDTLYTSKEDKLRTELYQLDSRRKSEARCFLDIEDYLVSLKTEITIRENYCDHLVRIAQLTQKTNQFNLTTHRYSEPDIRNFLESPQWYVLTADIKDKFGPLGVTGVLIFENQETSIKVDTYLLSCRVLGRGVEASFWLEGLKMVKKLWPGKDVLATYSPSAKNIQAREFWDKMGFSIIRESNGCREYLLDQSVSPEIIPSYIRICL